MTITTLFQQSSRFLLDLLFPPHCVHCGDSDGWLCTNCFAHISFIEPPICLRCSMPAPNGEAISCCSRCRHVFFSALDGVRSAALYEDNPIRSVIHAFKYNNSQVLTPTLAQMLAEVYRSYQLRADIIVPVPLHLSRFKERGYNQSELLAQSLGSLLNLPVDITSLQRTRKTKIQMELDLVGRRQNVAGAFSCQDQTLQGQKILLIDDVCTTGSTLEACAMALREEGGARSVWGLVLARAD